MDQVLEISALHYYLESISLPIFETKWEGTTLYLFGSLVVSTLCFSKRDVY